MDVDRETILREIQRVAAQRSISQLSQEDFHARTSIPMSQVRRFFDSWPEACLAAGLEHEAPAAQVDEDILLRDMYEVLIQFRAVPSQLKFKRKCRFSVDSYIARFGNWSNALTQLRIWVEKKHLHLPYAEKLPRPTAGNMIRESPGVLQRIPARTASSAHRPVYGSFLNFRELEHAPVNEQGVVFLFGMVCSDLGFVVENIRPQYPDCEAKRKIDKEGRKWERVSIEFEYLSSNFKGHDPKGCDIIVCWEHDWESCPPEIEVIELKKAIQNLDNWDLPPSKL